MVLDPIWPDRAVHARKRMGAIAIRSLLTQVAELARRLPVSDPTRYGVRVLEDIPYLDDGLAAHRLDIYLPPHLDSRAPVCLYVHGGGFRALSKNTHWLFGLTFARRGYVVANINYRLAPQHRFPAAVEDCCAALSWLARSCDHYGGDRDRLVLAGESAGANLITALCLACCTERPEPWARSVFALDLVPRAVLPACGIFQTTDPRRYRHRGLGFVTRDEIEGVCENYLPPEDALTPEQLELADPVVGVERALELRRPFPPFFLGVGSSDPLRDESARLHRALLERGATSVMRSYPGGVHAFHALVWSRQARAYRADAFAFLDDHVPR